MALDRFVCWKKEKPTVNELEKVLGNYLGGIGSIAFGNNRWMINLPGKPTEPLEGLNVPGTGTPFEPRSTQQERWFEIVWHEKVGRERGSIDIITRSADPFTNGVAEQFQKLCILYWQAEGDRDE